MAELKAAWPVRVGGVYKSNTPNSPISVKVTCVDGERIYFESWCAGEDDPYMAGDDTSADIFRQCYLPEDQSPIPALMAALKEAVAWKSLSVTEIAAENPSVLEYIAQFDRDVARMNAFAAVLGSIMCVDYRKWEDGLNTPEEFVRWSKSIAAHVLSQQHTAECIDASGVCTITGEV